MQQCCFIRTHKFILDLRPRAELQMATQNSRDLMVIMLILRSKMSSHPKKLRYESSIPTSQELSSPIFHCESVCLLAIGNN